MRSGSLALSAAISISIAIQQLAKIANSANGRLDSDIAALNGRFGRIDEILERVAELQSENASQIKALIAAQARADERLRVLLDVNFSTLTPKTRKTVKKAVNKESPN